jgi:protease-4
VEPYLNDEMSEENRMQIKALLTSLWEQLTDAIAEERELSVERLNEIADDLLARRADQAKELGLIDELVYEDQYYRALSNRLSGIDNELAANDKPNLVSLNKYLRYTKTKRLYTGKDRIAVLYASGTILYGEGGSSYIGQESIARALKRIREDRKVKAIVLRVNSPGGSALTSELIWRELKRTQETKPVVVSISDVAASGGYYIAMASDYIMAQPTSVTGSIGVFGTLPNFSELSKKIGVNPQWVETNKQSRGYSVFGPMTQQNYDEIKDGIEQTYDIFLDRVAEGRSMQKDQVDELAQGRVWSASSALENGLIDGYGGIYKAIEKAAELGETSDYAVQSFPRYKSEFEQLFGDLSEAQALILSRISKAFIPEPVNNFNQQIEQLKAKENQIQARMPFELNIR